ncbi:MAG: DUF2235 domain-containing protein, partial [Treponema sp.]|nr:DUF2235 domain-containing protein [Treponema sp.]
MGATTDSTPNRDATKEELHQYETVREQFEKLDKSDTYDSDNPNQRLFFVSFDGTRNDRDDPTPENIHTNPAILEKMVPDTKYVSSEYLNGVATRNDSLIEELNESRTGEGSKDRAEEAYERFVTKVQEWYGDNPDVEVHVSTAGFSRGTGSQRHFANLIYRDGVPDPDGNGFLIPPGDVHQDVMLMYDSVVTGQEHTLMLGIPPSVNAVHLTADHENRLFFDSASIVDPLYPNDPGILETGLPGAHSDVGGNYGYNGLSARSLALGRELFSSMGVPISETPDSNKIAPEDVTIHDSGVLDFDSLKNIIISFGNIEFGEREGFTVGNQARFAELPFEEQLAAIRRVETEREAEEAAYQQKVKANANIRAADLGIMQAKRDLEEAIDSGDTPEVIIAGLDYLSNFEDRIDLDPKTGENANKGPVGESTEALIDIASSGISLVNSIDNSDEWEIVDNSIDLVQDIDNYLGHSESKYADVINNNTSQILSLGAAGIGLGMALDEGDGWAISQSSATLLQGIDNYFPAGEEGAASVLDNALGFDAGNTGVAFEGVGSAIGLAVNIASLDDVFDSGNSAAAVYTVASTANNAIITYNAAVTLTGNATLAMGSSVPGLGYVAAAVQLTQGDVQGAAITAATTYLITLGPYGWAAAAVLQIGSILF